MLERLARSPGDVFSRVEFHFALGTNLRSSSRIIDVYVTKLRRKLGVTIDAVPGVGYRLLA